MSVGLLRSVKGGEIMAWGNYTEWERISYFYFYEEIQTENEWRIKAFMSFWISFYFVLPKVSFLHDNPIKMELKII